MASNLAHFGLSFSFISMTSLYSRLLLFTCCENTQVDWSLSSFHVANNSSSNVTRSFVKNGCNDGTHPQTTIVEITLTETQPPTSWNISAPREYGFYSNVNPAVDHPRWTQKRERRIGDFRKRKTLAFNGYADQVGALYAGMDLRKHF